MTERREVVVDSVLQRHQLRQYLNLLPGVAWSHKFIPGREFNFHITATAEQWTGIDQWLQRIGVQS